MASEGERERTRLEIAFGGGQTLGVTVAAVTADGFAAALGRDDGGAYALEAEDGTYVIPLRAVMYLKRFSRETQIGFGRTA